MWIGVLWTWSAGRHVDHPCGGKFHHGLLEKSLNNVAIFQSHQHITNPIPESDLHWCYFRTGCGGGGGQQRPSESLRITTTWANRRIILKMAQETHCPQVKWEVRKRAFTSKPYAYSSQSCCLFDGIVWMDVAPLTGAFELTRQTAKIWHIYCHGLRSGAPMREIQTTQTRNSSKICLTPHKFLLAPCTSSLVIFFLNFGRDILQEIWREFCGIFSDPQNKNSKISGKFRSIFRERKLVPRKRYFVPISFCRRATPTKFRGTKKTQTCITILKNTFLLYFLSFFIPQATLRRSTAVGIYALASHLKENRWQRQAAAGRDWGTIHKKIYL